MNNDLLSVDLIPRARGGAFRNVPPYKPNIGCCEGDDRIGPILLISICTRPDDVFCQRTAAALRHFFAIDPRVQWITWTFNTYTVILAADARTRSAAEELIADVNYILTKYGSYISRAVFYCVDRPDLGQTTILDDEYQADTNTPVSPVIKQIRRVQNRAARRHGRHIAHRSLAVVSSVHRPRVRRRIDKSSGASTITCNAILRAAEERIR